MSYSCDENVKRRGKNNVVAALIMVSLNKMLQRYRFCNVVRRFHRNYLATSKRRWIATSQQRWNNVIESTGSKCKIVYATGMYL